MAAFGLLADPTYRYSMNTFPGNGAQTNWEVNFAGGYINKSHVKAAITDTEGNTLVPEFTWVGDSTIRVTPAVPVGSVLTLYRDTPKIDPTADFTDGAIINELSLDLNSRQAVFIGQEVADTTEELRGLTGTLLPSIKAAVANGLASLSAQLLAGTSAISLTVTNGLAAISTARDAAVSTVSGMITSAQNALTATLASVNASLDAKVAAAAASASYVDTRRPRYFKAAQISTGQADASFRASSGTWLNGVSFVVNQSIRIANGLVSTAGSLSFGTEEGKVPLGDSYTDTRRPRYVKGMQAVFGQSDTTSRALTAVLLDGSEFGGNGGGGGGTTYDPYASGLLPSKNIYIVGDSMATENFRIGVRDYFGGSRSVVRMNRGGFTTNAVLDLMGIEPLTVTNAVTIPTSGGVTIELLTNPLFSGGTAIVGGTANMTIGGVSGVLSTTTGATPVLTFTRSTAGGSVSVAAGDPVTLAPINGTSAVPGTEVYRGNTLLLRIGRNDVKLSITDRVTSRDKLFKLVDYQTSLNRRVIIFGAYKGRAVMNGTSTPFEQDGSMSSDAYYEWRAMMQRDFPGVFIDCQEWARKEAIYELGLTPTADDLSDIASGCIPRQLFNSGDDIHMGVAMQTLEGTRAGKLLTIQGY